MHYVHPPPCHATLLCCAAAAAAAAAAAQVASVMKRSLLIELTVDESVEHVKTGGGLVVRDHVATFRDWESLVEIITMGQN